MRDKLGRFVKDHHYSSKTEFKKGHITWNKGKHPEYLQGKNHPMWKGGIIDNNGYIMVLIPTHPFCDRQGRVRRSRLVMEKYLGRYLKPEEVVHHKGIKYPLGSIENKQDDRIENLKLFPNHSKHLKSHWKQKKSN